MPYVLGVDVGGSNTSAAVCRRDGEGWAGPTVVPLGARSATIGSTLQVAPSGALTPRDATGHDGPAEPRRSIRGYARRVGDDVPFMIGDQPFPAHEATAAMVRSVVDRVWEIEGEPPEQVALACPSGWGPYRTRLLDEALRNRRLDDVVLVAAAVAAVAGHGAAGELPAPAVIAGYDLGGTGFTGSMVERRAGGGMELIDFVDHPVGGSDLDDALVAHVRARAGLTGRAGHRAADAGSVASSASSAAWLRDSCTAARERLSWAAEAVVPVPTPDGQFDVVVTGAELAELVRPLLQPTVDSLVRLIQVAGPERGEPVAVVLAGGATRTPALVELVAATVAVPVLADPQPEGVVVRGAAVVARWVVARARPTVRPHVSRRRG